jgi:hypothetical protein
MRDALKWHSGGLRVAGAIPELQLPTAARGGCPCLGVAVVIFWPAAFLIHGNAANAQEVAQLKGDMDAIEQANIQKKCNLQFKRDTPAAAGWRFSISATLLSEGGREMKARLWSLASTFALGLGALSTSSANAATIDPTDMKLVATVDTLGAYDNAGLDYYNGQPLSPTNYPSAYQDELSAQWNFYVNPSAKNELFIVASDVADSNFGTFMANRLIWLL